MGAIGFGLQAGCEKVDIIILIADDQEMNVFMGNGQIKLGTQYGITAGVSKFILLRRKY